MIDHTKINGGDLDRHITDRPDGIPAEKLEAATEDALRWWAAGHTLTQLQTLLADAEDEMARAYIEAGGDPEDAPKFDELRAACDRLEALVRPSDCAYFARSILQEANASLAMQAQHNKGIE